MERRKIHVGKKNIEAFCLSLGRKNFILLKGKKGYVMCGYLNLRTAEKAHDVAVKITGVSSISQAVSSVVQSCTSYAKKAGIQKGLPVRKVLKLIA